MAEDRYREVPEGIREARAGEDATTMHALEFDARVADDLFWFLSGEGSCALGLEGIDRLYDLLCERGGSEGRCWTLSEAERRELLDEMELQDCEEMTDDPSFARLKSALLALGGQRHSLTMPTTDGSPGCRPRAAPL